MIQNNLWKAADGFDKELLLVGEGYIARPVTVNKDTIPGLTPNDAGKYIIPYGTYLYGADGESLLANPQQYGVAVVPSVTHATATIGSSLVVTAKAEGNLSHVVTLVAGTTALSTPSITVTGTGASKTVTIDLAVDSIGTVVSTYGDIVDLINNDIVANTFLVAEMATGVDPDTLAAAGTGTTSGGGDETVDSDIDGILYHSVDVTDGEATGALIIHAYINVDNMPEVPGEAVKAKLPHIVFARKD